MDALKFILSRLDNTTAWIGVIGLALLVFNMHGFLAFLFVALFFMPETSFTGIFKRLTAWLRQREEELNK